MDTALALWAFSAGSTAVAFITTRRQIRHSHRPSYRGRIHA